MNYRKFLFTLTALMALTMNGCSKSVAPENYDASEVGKISQVVPGVLISERPVTISQKTNTDNSILGGLTASTPPPVDYNGGDKGFEYIVKLNTGNVISVVQTDDLKLNVDQHVLVIYGATTRVAPDQGS